MIQDKLFLQIQMCVQILQKNTSKKKLPDSVFGNPNQSLIQTTAGIILLMKKTMRAKKAARESTYRICRLRYDQEFREWAAAKGVQRWGELNLAIYGRCLSFQQVLLGSGKGKQSSYQAGDKKSWGACFKWNEGHCNRPCGYRHICSSCGESHVKTVCPLKAKKFKQA